MAETTPNWALPKERFGTPNAQLRKKPGDAWPFALSDHLPVFAAFQ